jgi:UDP-2,3-diacylglucosamine pyrophosphatase LpxH
MYLRSVVTRLLRISDLRKNKNWPASNDKYCVMHGDENCPLIWKTRIFVTAHPSRLQGIKWCRRLFGIIKERIESSARIAFLKAIEYQQNSRFEPKFASIFQSAFCGYEIKNVGLLHYHVASNQISDTQQSTVVSED